AYHNDSRANHRFVSSMVGPDATAGITVAQESPQFEPWVGTALPVRGPAVKIFGWRDSNHLLVGLWSSSRMSEMARERIATIDARTGTESPAIALEGRNDEQPDPAFATDLLDRPFAHATAPRSPMDPRLLPGIGLGLVLAGLFVFLMGWLGGVLPPRGTAAS